MLNGVSPTVRAMINSNFRIAHNLVHHLSFDIGIEQNFQFLGRRLFSEVQGAKVARLRRKFDIGFSADLAKVQQNLSTLNDSIWIVAHRVRNVISGHVIYNHGVKVMPNSSEYALNS